MNPDSMESSIHALQCRKDQVAAKIETMRSRPNRAKTLRRLEAYYRTLSKEERTLVLIHQSKTKSKMKESQISNKRRRGVRRAASRRGGSERCLESRDEHGISPISFSSMVLRDMFASKSRGDAPPRRKRANAQECLDFWMGVEQDSRAGPRKKRRIVSLTAATCLNIYDL